MVKNTQPSAWLAASSGGWVGLVTLAPVAPVALAALAYGLGGIVCHQLPDRSFHLEGHQLAVCARCTGIYAGAAVTFAWQAVRGLPLIDNGRRSGSLSVSAARACLVLGSVPTLATVLLESFSVWMPGNVVRAIAGLALGAGIAIVVGVTATVNYREWRQRRLE